MQWSWSKKYHTVEIFTFTLEVLSNVILNQNWLLDSASLRPEALLRLEHPSLQTLHFCELPFERAWPAGVFHWEQRYVFTQSLEMRRQGRFVHFPRSAGFNECRRHWQCLCVPAERAVYNLYAVSNHSGNTLGGHYTAYCRNPTLGEWYSYNDSRYLHLTSHIRLSVQPNYALCASCWMTMTSSCLYTGVSAFG